MESPSVLALGSLCVAAAVALYAFKLHVSYSSEGGALGMVPVLDGALVPPPLAAFGVCLAGRVVHWFGFYFVLLWVVLTVLAYQGLGVAAERGRRHHDSLRSAPNGLTPYRESPPRPPAPPDWTVTFEAMLDRVASVAGRVSCSVEALRLRTRLLLGLVVGVAIGVVTGVVTVWLTTSR